MNNSRTLTPVSTAHPPCPPWCTTTEHYDHDDFEFRFHFGPAIRVTFRDPQRPERLRSVGVQVQRYDEFGDLGRPVVAVGEVVGEVDGDWVRDGLHPDNPISADVARRLAAALLDAADLADGGQPTMPIRIPAGGAR